MRADKFLATSGFFKSRSQAKLAVDENRVLINGKAAKTSSTVNPGDEIEIIESEKPPEILDVNYDVIYEDDDILVVFKPSGVLVHPAQNGKQASLVDTLKKKVPLSRGYAPERPGIVHRLDRDTSGLLVVAKTDFAQDKLYEQFQEKTISRIYLAVTTRALKPDQGTLSSYLIRHPTFRTKRLSLRNPRTKKIIRPESSYAVRDHIEASEGRLATTHYKVLREGKNGVALLELTLETGRTHQIRVHLSEAGAPIIGDKMYSSIESEFPRCALHAYKLTLIHPRTQQSVSFLAKLPDDFKRLLKQSEIKYDI